MILFMEKTVFSESMNTFVSYIQILRFLYNIYRCQEFKFLTCQKREKKCSQHGCMLKSYSLALQSYVCYKYDSVMHFLTRNSITTSVKSHTRLLLQSVTKNSTLRCKWQVWLKKSSASMKIQKTFYVFLNAQVQLQQGEWGRGKHFWFFYHRRITIIGQTTQLPGLLFTIRECFSWGSIL